MSTGSASRERTWVDVPAGSPFGLDNLPYGVVRTSAGHHVVTAIGDQVVDLSAASAFGVLPDPDGLLAGPSLNPLLAAGRPQWTQVRREIVGLLTDQARAASTQRCLLDARDVVHVLPWELGDYVDFYSCEQHATNLGRILRPNTEPLNSNWKQLPVGYHGRAGTVVVSGTHVVRPSGLRPSGDDGAEYGLTRRLDIEAEIGFVVGTPSPLGRRVPTSGFRAHVFGVVLVNDWSARDIQAFEYVPLGPFLGKSFATSVSPWIVPLEALEHARIAPPQQDPQPAGYLRSVEDWGLDITLQVRINGEIVSRPPFAGMYWTPDQQLAHMTANGAGLRTGDLFASGTVSGERQDQRGSLIELTWNGESPLRLADGTERAFLTDGDTVSITATTRGDLQPHIGFGEVAGTVVPAR